MSFSGNLLLTGKIYNSLKHSLIQRQSIRYFTYSTKMTSEQQQQQEQQQPVTGNATVESPASPTAAYDTSKYEELTEGSAKILFPKSKVFYNPVQQYNRDLSCLAIRAWSEIYSEEKQEKRKRNKQPTNGSSSKKTASTAGVINPTSTEVENNEGEEDESKTAVEESTPVQEPFVHILEALSATGLRAIRYGKEIPLVQTVIANDLSKAAVSAINVNVNYNNISSKVKPNEGDAITYMGNNRSKFHVVDLDPYGTATPFMDTAIQAIKDDGLLLVTCTDLGVLAGNGYPEKCFALYGGTNLWGDATHESALRLVLNMIASTAAKYKKYIEPQLCLSIDFYVRLFIRVKTSPIRVKELASNTMITYRCSGCYSTADQHLGKVTANPNGKTKQNNKKYGLAKGPPVGPTCSFCGSTNHLTGPMWAGRLQNPEFIDRVLKLEEEASTDVYKTLPRIRGMLTMAKNELLDTHFYFKTTTLSSILKVTAPSIDVISAALGNLGYQASLTHAMTNCIKTDAPWEVIWFIGKKWCEKNSIDVEKMNKNAMGYHILTNDKIGEGIKLDELKPEDSKQSDLEWLFSENAVSKELKRLRTIRIVRYQENPTKNWGPKARPK